MASETTASVPPGWQGNPSSWPQRLPIIGVALVGFAIATYLALYQYGVVDTVWEPFFGDGSENVLDSKLSRVLPVSDATLGAAGYLADAVTGLLFGVARWRTQPWIVIVFGFAVGPLGLTSILLVIAQPVLYDSFCTLCMTSAAISLAMIPAAVDEVLASLQHLRRVQRRGGSLWAAFWGRS
ncbi:MAG TPA: vitamin K epoxide reductase family protein [Nocardioidaceae bacterium]|nr:vitamin K epoxide reductase family protein [Nocardioidaceae bacterium]